MSSTITIGPSKDYDGVDAIYNACSDFSTLAGEGVVTLELYPGYTYDAGIILNQSGVDASNYFHIKPAPAYYYPGDITNKIALKMKNRGGIWTSDWGGIGGFWLKTGYHKFESFKWRCEDGDGASGIGFMDYLAGSAVVVDVEIFDVGMDNIKSGTAPDNFGLFMYIYDPLTTITVRNSILYHLNRGSVPAMGSASSNANIKIYNSIVFNRPNQNWGNSTVTMKNTGYVMLINDETDAGSINGVSNFTGLNNYDNLYSGQTDFGSNHLRSSRTNMAFIDISSKNFAINLTSNLAGSGVYDGNNPTNIQRATWINNHRSPFETPVLVDTATPAPFNCSKIYGCYEDDCVLAIPYTENPYDVNNFYQSTSETIYGVYEWEDTIYGKNRFNNLNYNSYDTYNVGLDVKDKMTFVLNIKKDSGTGLNYLITGSGTEDDLNITFDLGTNEIRFTIGTWYGYFDIDTNNDITKWTQIQILCDLTKSTDAERLIIYTSCCGGRIKETLTFSGTAPTTLGAIDYFYIGSSPAIYASTYVYENIIPDFILEDISDDPYIPFRDPLDLMGLAMGGFLSNLLSSLWFLRKFIMRS